MKRTFRAAAVLTVVLAIPGLTSIPANALDIPCNTARVIVPWGAGGESDIVFRMVTDAANRNGAKPQLQVVNVGGQGGIKGTKQSAGAKPDGCTVFSTFQHILASNLTGRLEFTWDSFVPVARLTQTVSLIGAGGKAPFDDYKSMQAWAKANPGKLLAGGTLGSTSHFTLLQVQDALGIDMKVISYDGTADRMKAMLANTIHIGQVSEATAAKHVSTGAIKTIAINYDKRSPILPDVPTAKEQGFDIEITSDRGIVLPKGASKELVTYYADLMEKVAKDPAFVKAVTEKGSFVAFLRDDDYVNWWKKTNDEWTAIAKRLGVYRQ